MNHISWLDSSDMTKIRFWSNHPPLFHPVHNCVILQNVIDNIINTGVFLLINL